jgi:hypothetical protein
VAAGRWSTSPRYRAARKTGPTSRSLTTTVASPPTTAARPSTEDPRVSSTSPVTGRPVALATDTTAVTGDPKREVSGETLVILMTDATLATVTVSAPSLPVSRVSPE